MRYFTVATAGHVDHGKTSLLKALTGIDPDRLKEEKERQMTTDLGFAHMSLADDMVVGFVDVPGHGKFLKNMLAGVGCIDMALLVVAADEGPMPQTVQHVRILSFLGVPNVLVALNKIDTCDIEQSDISRRKTEELLKEYQLNLVGIIPVSAIKEQGLSELKQSIFQLCSTSKAISDEGSLFFPIDRAFTKPGFGTVVTGTLVSGVLQSGDQIIVGNKNVKAKVRRLESFGKTIDKASAGQRVAVNLASKEALVRGDVLLSKELLPANVLIASLFMHPQVKEVSLNSLAGQDVRIYHGTAEAVGRIRLVAPMSDGVGQVVKIALLTPIVARTADRLIMRLGDDTICGGSILLLDPPRWLTKVKMPGLAQLISKGDLHNALCEYLQMCPQGLMRLDELNRVLPAGSTALADLVQNGSWVQADSWVMRKVTRDNLAEKIAAIVSKTSSISLETARNTVMPNAKRDVFQSVVHYLVSSGRIEIKGDKLVLRGMPEKDAAFGQREKLRSQIKEILGQTICLEIEEVARLANVDVKLVRTAIADLSKGKEATVVAYEFVALQDSIDKCHSVIGELWQKRQDIAPGEFREALGVSRKYAMALLSYFDDQLITRRLPSGRVLLRAPGN